MPDDNEEGKGEEKDWRWIDEHIEHPTPEVAGNEVCIIGKEERTRPSQDQNDQEGDEQMKRRDSIEASDR